MNQERTAKWAVIELDRFLNNSEVGFFQLSLGRLEGFQMHEISTALIYLAFDTQEIARVLNFGWCSKEVKWSSRSWLRGMLNSLGWVSEECYNSVAQALERKYDK